MLSTFNNMSVIPVPSDSMFYISPGNDYISGHAQAHWELINEGMDMSRVNLVRGNYTRLINQINRPYYIESLKLTRLQSYLASAAFARAELNEDMSKIFIDVVPQLAEANVDIYNTISLFNEPKVVYDIYRNSNNWKLFPGTRSTLIESFSKMKINSPRAYDLMSSIINHSLSIRNTFTALAHFMSGFGYPVYTELTKATSQDWGYQDIDWGKNPNLYPVMSMDIQKDWIQNCGMSESDTNEYIAELYIVQLSNLLGITWDTLVLNGTIIPMEDYTLVFYPSNNDLPESIYSHFQEYGGIQFMKVLQGAVASTDPRQTLMIPGIISTLSLPYELAPLSERKKTAVATAKLYGEWYDRLDRAQIMIEQFFTFFTHQKMQQKISRMSESVEAPKVIEYANDFSW